MTSLNADCLPVSHIARIKEETHKPRWLVESLWQRSAVGILGGHPKASKSWLGLDIALSVASGTPCLDRFAVQSSAPVLIYLAEDSLPDVRARVQGICAHRSLDIEEPKLVTITANSLELDQSTTQSRLFKTLEALRPKLLLLDPLVRLHSLDENSASEISKLLRYFRSLQRRFDMAVILVHHTSKKHYSNPGQSLRGSSDLHAWGDSNVYLKRKDDSFILTVEHRSNPSPKPFALCLRSEGAATFLQISDRCPKTQTHDELVTTVLKHFQSHPAPITRTALRDILQVNNQKLGFALQKLQACGTIVHEKLGWCPS